MKLISTKALMFVFFFSISSFCFAHNNSLDGLWRTYDNDGHARSIIKFHQTGNRVQGKLVKILPLAGKDDKICTQCKNQYANKPLAGMVIVWGLQPQDGKWVNGKVLDTDSGKTYNCSITLSNDGNTLHFYAYAFGPFGATIDWQRAR